ncbi:reverse transcriptase domain-containing protein [Tanacetum coccineum]
MSNKNYDMGMQKLANSKNLVYMPILPSGKSTILSPRSGNSGCRSSDIPYSEVNSSRYSSVMVDMVVSSCTENKMCAAVCLPRVLHLLFRRLDTAWKVKRFRAHLSHHLAVFAVSWFMGPHNALAVLGIYDDADISSLVNVPVVPAMATSPRLGDMMTYTVADHGHRHSASWDPYAVVIIRSRGTFVERWAMPRWCHMFNSTLIGAARVWFDELPPESIDGYKGLKSAFLAYFMQQKKYVKDPVEIHNIKQRDGETIEDFIECFKVETGSMKGAPECMRISGFMHGPREGRGSSRFTPLIKTPKEILATEAGKFKLPPPMVTTVEKRSSNKFCDFHNDKWHSTDECMQLKRQIEELVRAGKLSHLIKEIKQGRDQIKNRKKEASAKDKSLAIYMIQQWQRTTRQKLTQSFAYDSEITFPPLADSDGTEGPLVIEVEIVGHMIHRMYIDEDHCTKAWMDFMIVRSISPYNGIIGRPVIREIQAVPSTAHIMLKFPADGGIVTIRSTILIPAECATVITSPKEIPKEAGMSHQNLKVAIHPNFPNQEVVIGGTLSLTGRTELCTYLKKNLDIFAWQPSDMTGVPRSIAEHRLNIREGYSPVRQKKRGQAPECAKAIQAEVQKLVAAGIMREVYYHDWLSNPVLVKKHNGSWRMCVDFTDLNKACPQDCYPLPEIDWKIESLCGYPFKCFLDAYKGYHQIQMAESDEEITAFHTSQGVYCYTKMPFGLKNAGATYQQIVDKAFDSQVGRNMEVAVEGMFLGYTITPEGIKPCPDKTEAVLQLPSPQTIKEVQSFNGKLASLNRFLSKSVEKSLPLFKTLKRCIKKSDFRWTPEAEQAFKQLKQHLSELPLLVAPKPKEELIVYLSTSYGAVSAVLMTERGTIQTPVYFISRALQGLELNYTPMEKLVLSLVFAAKRPQRYFQVHPIAVITDQPIKQIMSRPDVAGRLQKWSVMLGEHNITYRPRTSVKGQMLADFLVEKPDKNPPNTPVVATLLEPWTLFTNGSSCVDGSGAGLILTSPEGTKFTYVLRFQFTASNNEAEYEALIAGLQIAAQIGVQNVQLNVDSKLVANQVLGTYVAKEENMIKYLEKVKGLVSGFANFSISQVPRNNNKKADALSKIASTSFAHLSKQVLVEVLQEKSIQEKEVTTVVEEDGLTWMTPIIEYLKDGLFLGIDIAGPFPEGSGKVKFLIVAMDYFTKWIEAKAVATITGNQVKKFVWDNIVCRFGLPGEIISDNGKQFSDNPFKDWCDKLNIMQRFASIKYPQSNRLVEKANRSLGEGIKARLGEGNKNWLKELPHVLWAHRTMIKSSHEDTPFSLTYGMEAVILAEIGMPTYRTATVDTVHNDEELRLNLDLLEEKREHTTICKAKSKMKMAKYYNARVRGVAFRPEDFVYRSNDASHATDGGKLGPKLEGPYEVTEALGDGAYKLWTMDGTDLPRTWNIANLKKCYL